jgi:hypothetical protein
MMRFVRPPKPGGFDDHVAAAKKHIADLAAAGTRPKSADFEDRWGAFKPHFINAQHRKCGFCESKVTHVDTGDVEHYRPKAGITCLPANRSRWGRELPDAGNSEGRSPDDLCEWGYHFLAYEWDNYLFACGRCNRAWKGNLFPLALPSSAQPTAVSAAAEAPLLLNPYEGMDPTQCLKLLESTPGQIVPREAQPGVESPHGRATIDTCCLDRPSMVDARSEKASQTFQRLKELDESGDQPDRETDEVLQALRVLGDRDHAYAGLVRGTFEAWMEMRWEEAFGPEEPAGTRTP